MKAAIYTRVSTERQAGADRVSLSVQRERCEAFCREKGWMVVAVETDHESGLKTTRSGYQRVLQLARSREIQHVVVFAASRFGRRASEVLSRIEELRDQHGVELHSTQEDLSSFLMVGITAVINEQQSRTISANAVPAKLARAHDGYWLAHAPFGTRNNHGILEPNESIDVLQGMFLRAAQGFSVRQIALWANALLEKPMTREGAREILRNTAYIGKTRWAGETLPGRWDPLVEPELWRLAQRVVRRRRNERAAVDRERPHWIIGLAYCASCGTRMSRRIAVKTWGTKYEYLACNQKDRDRITVGCGAPHLPIRRVQEEVLAQLAGLDSSGVELLCGALERLNEKRAREGSADTLTLRGERARLQDRLLRARQAYMDRVYEAADYHRVTSGIGETIAALDERLADDATGSAFDVGAVRAVFEGDWRARATEAPLEFREFLRVFVERIDVGPLRITWREGISVALKV